MLIRARRSLRLRRVGGFSLIELMTVIALMSILVMATMPSFATWTRNVKVRTAADDLQNAIRTAQTEAMRRSRQVVFVIGNSPQSPTLNASDDGTQWAIAALPLSTGSPSVIEAGSVTDVANGVRVTGPAALCFNSMGRLVSNSHVPIEGAKCEIKAAKPISSFTLDMDGADRPLSVTVALGGQVRLCDPAKTLSATNPDGCPEP